MQQTEGGQPTDPEASGEEAADHEKRWVSAADIKKALLANYPTVQYHYVQFLAEHLTDCRRSLGGDFDNLMILAVLGQRFLGAYRELPPGEIPDDARVFMSALRIADVTGIPRESVRRKLGELKGRGWVENHRAHGWRLAGQRGRTVARFDLASLDERGIDRLARMMAGLSPILTGAKGASEAS